MKKWFFISACLLACGCNFSSSDSKEDKRSKTTLSVAATPIPQAKMLAFVKDDLAKQGIILNIVEVTDYNIPNRALAENEVDANFFQHSPFLDEQIKEFGYSIECYAKIHIEPMAFYSKRIKSLRDLKPGSTVVIPNDPTNEYRALLLLQQAGVITLKPNQNLQATVASIATNPRSLRFKEVDAALISRSLTEVDAAAIPTNFALQAGLSPKADGIAMEGANSPYVDIIAIRNGDENIPKLEALKKAMLSDKMRQFIETEFKGNVVPVLTDCK